MNTGPTPVRRGSVFTVRSHIRVFGEIDNAVVTRGGLIEQVLVIRITAGLICCRCVVEAVERHYPRVPARSTNISGPTTRRLASSGYPVDPDPSDSNMQPSTIA